MNGDAEVLETKFFATEGGPLVSAILMRPGDAHAFMLFGHGVGMSVEHPVMVRTASALAGQGIATFRFNYPYSELGRQADWGTSLDPLKVLLATACSAVGFAAKAAEGLPFFVGGRSMSS